MQKGAIAQLVEQRTENPCVTGSIPVGTTQKIRELEFLLTLFFVLIWYQFPVTKKPVYGIKKAYLYVKKVSAE